MNDELFSVSEILALASKFGAALTDSDKQQIVQDVLNSISQGGASGAFVLLDDGILTFSISQGDA